MSDAKGSGSSDEEETRLERVVEQVRQRCEHRDRTGELPLSRTLGMMGRFGWTIVGPTLLGAFIGRWLDGHFHSGVFWSATLVLVGVTAGFYMVWKRMNAES